MTKETQNLKRSEKAMKLIIQDPYLKQMAGHEAVIKTIAS